MEAKNKIKLESIAPYKHLFPEALVMDKTVKRGANVSHTVNFIPRVVQQTSWQVKKYVDRELRGLPTYEACEKLWRFVKYHIAYEKDEQGLEQIRSPRRLIHDLKGDCDCFTTFIDACLYELGIPVINRITKYGHNYFQHIYPIVPIGKGRYIVMDCVVGQFNYEEPYTEKKDYKMDLEFLDGIDDNSALIGVDARDILNYSNDIGELGKLLRRSGGGAKPNLFKKKTPEQRQQRKEARKANVQNLKKKVGKTVHKINRVNPATALLRGGILASMKLNLLKVAESLKWGYATREYAQSKGMDMSKYEKLKGVLAKSEKIFYGAGGKPENLKKAILTGRGNRNHEVAGLEDLDETTRMPELLGSIYEDEFVSGLEGLGQIGQLGEPATAAAITAASGAMATLAALLKSIGPLFPQKNNSSSKPGASDQQPADASNTSSEPGLLVPSQIDETQQLPEDQTEPASSPEDEEPVESDSEDLNKSKDDGLPATTSVDPNIAPIETDNNGDDEPTPDQEGTNGLAGTSVGLKVFWEKNKSWIKPTGIVLGAAAVIGIGALIFSKSRKTKNKGNYNSALNGPSNKRKKKKGGRGGNYGKKTLIPLS